jgi:hypothetical protein
MSDFGYSTHREERQFGAIRGSQPPSVYTIPALSPADQLRVAAQLDLHAAELERADPADELVPVYRKQAAQLRAEHFAELLRKLEGE